jgi:RNA ligase (TIGR02306 family)
MRKMAEVVLIDDVVIHPNADLLDVCTVKGWKCVTKRGEFRAGDLAIYCAIDSWVPHDLAPFLTKGPTPKKYDGVDGNLLRSIRLRGVVSQGLILPFDVLTRVDSMFPAISIVGADVSQLLGIQKYEPPVPACLSGIVKGAWPSQTCKTDEERCLSGDTIIITDIGPKTIKEIVDSKLQCQVLSFNHTSDEAEFKSIIGVSVMTRKSCWLKIKTKSGKSLILTKNHKVWIEDLQCYRNAAELCIDDKLKIYSEN